MTDRLTTQQKLNRVADFLGINTAFYYYIPEENKVVTYPKVLYFNTDVPTIGNEPGDTYFSYICTLLSKLTDDVPYSDVLKKSLTAQIAAGSGRLINLACDIAHTVEKEQSH